jgi:uncharacterized membrane protein
MNLHRVLESGENFRAADKPAARVAALGRRVFGKNRAGEVLRGSWLGHPLHPLLVTVPIGAWVSSSLLDARPGYDDAARKLVGIGLVAAGPTVVLGLVDYVELDERQRRVGFIHAVTNMAAAACLLASYRCRSSGAHGTGKVLNLVGLTMLSAGGALGGHLSYAQGAGVYRWRSEPPFRRITPT